MNTQPRTTRLVAAVACVAVSIVGGCQWAATGQNAQGVRLHEQGQFTAAMQQFQQAINSDPKNPDGYYNLASTTHHLGVQRNDPRLIDQAESLYNQCLDLAPNHVECHRGLAVLLMETKRPDKAFTLMKNWVSTNPQLADARIELARLYQEAGSVRRHKNISRTRFTRVHRIQELGSPWPNSAKPQAT